MNDRAFQSIVGCMLGTAVGDALSLPYKGLSRDRIQKFVPLIRGHRFILSKGAISYNTEHICMVAQSLIISGGEEAEFTHALATRLRWWLLGLPIGINLGTLKAIAKLWQKSPSTASGTNSAENSPAVRSAILGVCYGAERQKLLSLVRASTTMTHSDFKAQHGAIAVAVAAYLAASQVSVSPQDYYLTLQKYFDPLPEEFISLIKQACDSAAKKETGAMFANYFGDRAGVSSDVYHAIPIVIQVWLRYQQDYFYGVREIICLGGNTNATATILGGIVGASVGKSGIPRKWLKDIWDFPRTVKWIEALGARLAKTCLEEIKQPPLALAFYLIPLRNLLFLGIYVIHACRRIFPPY